MNALVIADRAPKINFQEVIEEYSVELVVTLGDLERHDLLELALVQNVPKIGVYGNHCSGTYMPELGIMNMHMSTWRYKNMQFGGFEGCVRYKENPDAIMYTQTEASQLLGYFPPVDVMLCHCPPRGINDESELAHQGFDGLRTYIERAPPSVLLHGHTYPTEQTLQRQFGPTRIEYVHSWKIVAL